MANKIGKKIPNKGAGRPKGALNKTTATAKEAIMLVAEGVGGVDRMIQWVKEDPGNEKVFWSQMYVKLLPHQVEGTGDKGEIVFRTIYEAKPD